MALPLVNLAEILTTPKAVFAGLRKQPKWFVSFVIITLIALGLGWLLLPTSEQIARSMLSGESDAAYIQRVIAIGKSFTYIGFLCTPALLLLKWLLLSALLYFSCVLCDAPYVRFKGVYAAVVHAEIILVSMGIFNLGLLYVRGIESIQHASDLHAIVGLDILIRHREANLPLFAFLNSINVFTAWYVGTLTIGVSVMTGLSKVKSSLIVGTMWLFAVGFRVAFVAISGNSALAFAG